MQGRAAGIVLGCIIAVIAIGYKFTQRDSQGEDYRQQMVSMIEQLPDYNTHGSLYLQWFDENHETCFNNNYHLGGRRSASWLDGDAYLDELFTAMAAAASRAGYTEQAENIRVLQSEVYFEEE